MEDTIKVFGVMATLFALYKVVVDVVLAKSSKRREEYTFTERFLVALYDSSTHPYIIEKGFFALTGGNYSREEIKYLLTFSAPSVAIEKRSSAGEIVNFNAANHEYRWAKYYRFRMVRTCGPKCYMAGYIFFFSLALLPFYSGLTPYLENGFIAIPGFSKWVSVVSFTVVAVGCLISRGELIDAKLFMNIVSARGVPTPCPAVVSPI